MAGGKSSRMGTEKGLITFNGKTFITHIIDAINPLVNKIFIVTNSNLYDHLPYEKIRDKVKEKGPLGGIYSGLAHSDTDLNLFLSCDIPLINKETINYLIETAQLNNNTSVITHANKIEPLCAIYSKKINFIVYKLIQNNELSILKALNNFDSKLVDISHKDFYNEIYFTNINNKEELNIAENIDQ